ncbi:AAA family ATPase [Pseudohyphozyma bogoriensis]|nr:AAA family ATPase [Pseudohyphozyma bogoriensis]
MTISRRSSSRVVEHAGPAAHETGRSTRRSAAKPVVHDSEDAEGEMDDEFAPLAEGGEDAMEGVADGGDEDAYGEDEEEVVGRSTRAKGKKRVVIDEDDEDEEAEKPQVVVTTSLHGRKVKRPVHYAGASDDSEEDEVVKPAGRIRRGGSSRKQEDDFVEQDEDDGEDYGYGERRSTRSSGRSTRDSEKKRKDAERNRRIKRENADISYETEGEHDETGTDTDEEDLDLHDDDDDDIIEGVPTKRNLRQKAKIDYYTIPPLEAPADKKKKKGRSGDPFSGLPMNMTGAQWAALYPEKNGQPDSSDDDTPDLSSPRKAALFSSNAAAAAAGFGGGGMFAGGANLDLAAAGTPNNLGKVNATLADTDPLGVASNISFDSVGGLGSHIQQLKEMVSLPLLYPEVFERFNITPPRGVLFHGPPGTGKTLLARALAASCSTEGRKISFFMRKGADCLSKWVGEAERQLRLLFEEAKACQPSIIFFDEIDGLAPVRSSKQEQIHASIVSTLLALMDGMDGRGQVIVIGATNRPDAIDPALRRPGRFDREFYFPLPNLEGRRKIIDIHTSGWNPPLAEEFKDELSHLTKGYGGADLRALCTEAALNAVQRTYPQIYKTNDRLVIKPETIDVTARDFIISQKNLIPSTARATSSSAAPIPPQLEPLLNPAFEAAKLALSKVLPEVKKTNILEDAEWEDDGGGFEKEKMIQAFETLRVFRPRMLVCGESGMGQGYIGAAVLHHLEGFHVQTLDLATLVSDSSRTMEAACVQLFVEAKRHKPSILFIPSLITWCYSVNETVRSTVKGLLEGLDPSDPILLLAVVEGPLSELPSDVRSWFGFVKGNRVVMGKPGPDQRRAFFADVIAGIKRSPADFPDALPRRKRILEKLPIAPPPPPREPTEAEIKAQELSDIRLLEYLKWRLSPILAELKKRYKRFTRSYHTDWRNDDLEWRQEQQKKGEAITGLGVQPYHNVNLDSMHLDLYNGVYLTPDDFLEDILRIQHNAGINANLEHDAEAPIKAGQMVNHSNVMIDQTFDAAFKADCVKMAERLKAAGRNVKGKGKGKAVQDPAALAAIADAGGGRQYSTRSKSGEDGSGEPLEGGDVNDVLHRAKRQRVEEDGSVVIDEEGQGPSKRPKAVVNGETNGINGHGGENEIQVEGDETPVASTSEPAAPSGLADLLNSGPPSSTSQPDFAPAPPALPGASTADVAPGGGAPLVMAPPMQVGALPDVSQSSVLGLFNDAPAASSLPPGADLPGGGLATSSAMVIGGSSGSHVHFADNAEGASGAVTTPTNSGPAPPAEAVPEREESPIAVDPPTPEPLPDFVVSEADVQVFATFLEEGTGALTIDQLEQLRAACYDIIWRGRKDWDRAEMLSSLDELAKGFVEEVEEL